jgi:hypothetical protein
LKRTNEFESHEGILRGKAGGGQGWNLAALDRRAASVLVDQENWVRQGQKAEKSLVQVAARAADESAAKTTTRVWL